MGKFLDIIGGLASLNRGDVEGFNAGMTKEGRARLAQQRANQGVQQQLMAEVLAKAQQDPQYNALLQQAVRPYLENKALETTTAGQQKANDQADQVAKYFAQYGGSPQSANHQQGQQQMDMQRDWQATQAGFTAQELEQRRAEAAQRGEQFNMSHQLNVEQLNNQNNQWAGDLAMRQAQLEAQQNQWGAGNAIDQQRLNDAQKQFEFEAGQRQGTLELQRQAQLLGLVGQFYPDVSGPSHVQRSLMEQAGVNIPEDPQAVAARNAANAMMEKLNQKRGAKPGSTNSPAATPKQLPLGSGMLVPPWTKPLVQKAVEGGQAAQRMFDTAQANPVSSNILQDIKGMAVGDQFSRIGFPGAMPINSLQKALDILTQLIAAQNSGATNNVQQP